MKAVMLYEYGGPEKLHYVTDAPDPQMADNDILIAVSAASMNPVDVKIRSGAAQERFPQTFPTILGRDGSGIVRAVGADVRHVAPGDRVMFLAWRTHAELVLAKANEVNHIPDGVDIIEAAALPLVVLTGDQLIRHGAQVQKGQTVLITGALGSVGRAAVHTAKKIGAKVIAGVRSSQREQAKELEVTAIFALDDEAEFEKLGLVDAVADTIGGSLAEKLLPHVKQGGKFGTVITPPPAGDLHPTVQITRFMAQPDASKVREFADDYRDGKFKLPIAQMLSLDKEAEAHKLLEHGHPAGKVLLLVI
jgi:NADPH:quinone reductase-like Zn-dependent oxidoreductase